MTLSGSSLDDWRQDRVAAAERGQNPTVLARMSTGWAVIGDTQFLPGYCVLLYAGAADQLTELPRPQRRAFLNDMALLGEAVQAGASQIDPGFARINYEILGNSLHHLHAHIFARYAWEPESHRRGPIWNYGPERTAPEHALSGAHEPLREAITAELHRIMAEDREHSGHVPGQELHRSSPESYGND